MSTPALRIDIVSDIVCPWCVIGYKRLELALNELPTDTSVSLHWQPFDLTVTGRCVGHQVRLEVAQSAIALCEFFVML